MVIAPVDLARFQNVLAGPAGWTDVALTGFAIGLAWALDRGIHRRRARRADPAHPIPAHPVPAHPLPDAAPGADARLSPVTFPLLAVVFLFIAGWVYRRAFGEPLLIDIALPLMAAMAIIRALIYGLRRLFPRQDWLPGWERGIGAAVWLLLLLYFVGVLPDIVAALDDVELPIGRSRVTLLSVLSGVAVVLGTLIATLWISGLIETRLNRATRIDKNLRAVMTRLIRVVLLAIGVLIALQGVGFDLTLLTVFGGAIGVCIGLGLQKLASNYIAGFTILLDRSIRLGDTITVEGKWMGTVTSVTARYVLLRRLDGVEVIVPNETLVITTVLNHSHAAPQIRVPLSVPVSRDANVEQALSLLQEAALADPRVLRDAPHAPGAFVAGFSDTGVQLELGVWVNNPLIDQLDLRSVIHRAVLRLFAAHGIALAYPHRDVIVHDQRHDAADEGGGSGTGGASWPAGRGAAPGGPGNAPVPAPPAALSGLAGAALIGEAAGLSAPDGSAGSGETVPPGATSLG